MAFKGSKCLILVALPVSAVLTATKLPRSTIGLRSEDYQTTLSATATTIEQELLTLDLGLNHYYYCTIIVVPLGLHHQVEVEDRLTMVVFNRYPPRWYI